MNDITIVTGSLPPDVCGVGDYTSRLAQALDEAGLTVRFFYRSDWRLRSAFRYIRAIRAMRPLLINIQHPTAGYGYSLVPQIIAMFCGKSKTVVTLHEFSRRKLKGKIAIYLFFLCADWIVFTSDEELHVAQKLAPWIARRSSVIPIGSNIPFYESDKRDIDVAYFGLIRPGKGVETFVSALESVARRYQLVSCIIGNVSPGCNEYAINLASQVRRFGTVLFLGQTPEDVARRLSHVRVALLPFPDGMSMRRGSAMAAMGNGALVLSVAGSQKSTLFGQISVLVDLDAALPDKLVQILKDYELYDEIRTAGQRYARARTWSSIAASYQAIIDDLLPQNSDSNRR